MTCKWCDGGDCLLCQLGDFGKLHEETGGMRSSAGILLDIQDMAPELVVPCDSIYHSSPLCSLCKIPYREMAAHYRHSHPGVVFDIKKAR